MRYYWQDREGCHWGLGDKERTAKKSPISNALGLAARRTGHYFLLTELHLTIESRLLLIMKSIGPFLNLIYPGVGSAINGRLLQGLFTQIILLLYLTTTCQLELLDSASGIVFLLTSVVLVQIITLIILTQQVSLQQKIWQRSFNVALLAACSAMFIFVIVNHHGTLLGYRVYFVPSQSMQPALEPGDIILVNSKRLETREWKKGDIIVFADKKKSDYYYTKRIADKPNHLRVSSDELYFVLGDNAEHSADSRALGLIHRRQFMGKVELVLWNITHAERWLVDL